MSKIVIDCRAWNLSGIGTYLKNLVPGVVKNFSKHEFLLLIGESDLTSFEQFKLENVSLLTVKSKIYSIREQFEILSSIPSDTRLFWSPHYNIPLLYAGRLLVTVYDLCHLVFPEYRNNIIKYLYARLFFESLRVKANGILCISDFTKQELIKLTSFGKRDQTITTTLLGIDSKWFSLEKVSNPLPFNDPYLIYIGNVKPHKNLKVLLKAFQLIQSKLPHKLVILGKKEGFITGDKEIETLATSLSDRIIFTGYVSDHFLEQSLIHADGLVFPSLYEGFGFPPLEAMACGCPAIVSNIPAVVEVCADAAIYFDPYSSHDLAQKIEMLLGNPEISEQYRKKGLLHVTQYSWEQCIAETCIIVEALL